MLKQQSICGLSTPTANVAINKSRLKIYNKSSIPTYFLEKGQEFQIELFNPTSDTVLAKIELNGKYISQSGLVLRPGERVHLDRYIDIPKKFLFTTYEVSNTEEVKKAIQDNGDLRVEFYKEYVAPAYNPWIIQPSWTYTPFIGYCGSSNSGTASYLNGTVTTSNASASSFTSSVNMNDVVNCSANMDKSASLDWLSQDFEDTHKPIKKGLRKRLRKESIETGIVEAGSHSNQEFKTVNKTFDTWAFHTVSYKLLPASQKLNTVEEVNLRRYCTNCGTKSKPNFKFCPNCGAKA